MKTLSFIVYDGFETSDRHCPSNFFLPALSEFSKGKFGSGEIFIRSFYSCRRQFIDSSAISIIRNGAEIWSRARPGRAERSGELEDEQYAYREKEKEEEEEKEKR